MNPIPLFNSLVQLLRQHQFRIPEPALWLALAAGAGATVLALVSLPTLIPVGAVITLVAGTGVIRWKYHRHRSRGGLVVTLFSAGQGTLERPDEVRRLILESLQDHLTEDEAKLVHFVPTVVGSNDRDFAIRLRKRLRARFLLHGRIAQGEQGYSVYARVTQPTEKGVVHLDSITKDVTFERASWRTLINRLTTARNVVDAEYPLEFAKELEAVVRGTAGQLAEDQGDYVRAERLLREALQVAPESTSHQIDLIRVGLARSTLLGDLGERNAVNILRDRTADPDAAPELLRSLSGLLFLCDENLREEFHQEALRALRAAAAQKSDPQLALTLYNLAMETDDHVETASLADQLLTSKTHYRNAWYLHRQRGAMYWQEAKEAERRGDDSVTDSLFRSAAYHYTKAIKRRPHFALRLRWLSLDFYAYRTPPLLYANAADAHREAGQDWRFLWYLNRAEHRRRRLFKKARRALRRERWARAVLLLDQVAMVRPDSLSTGAMTYQAAALAQMGDKAEAEKMWRAALASGPDARGWRATLSEPPLGLPVDDLSSE